MDSTQNTSKFALEDIISNMPDNVVTEILNRLPIQEAVRTSILARNWRFKWTILSQLVFDEDFFGYLSDTKNENDYAIIISRLLLNLNGTITKFVLSVKEEYNNEDIAHWLLFLSRKGLKDLTIFKMNGEAVELPARLFSCLELKHLDLENCCLNPPASFHGFPKLLHLELVRVEFKRGKIGMFITQCPVLQILSMGENYSPEVKLVEIAKLTNLKILSLALSDFAKNMVTSCNSILDLMGSFPKLEELVLDFQCCKLTGCGAKKSFPTTFPCLEALTLTNIDLGNGIMLLCAFELIRCTPNLQYLEITPFGYDADPSPAISEEEYNTILGLQYDDPPPTTYSLDVDYNTRGTLKLKSVVFNKLKGLKNEVYLIKYLLAYSPFLEEFDIHPGSPLSLVEKLSITTKLLKLHRASPNAAINFNYF